MKSYNDASYEINKRAMLEENYNLAHTQQKRKQDIQNLVQKVSFTKDWPQTGKGSKDCIERYCDSIIDILEFGSENMLIY